MSIRADALIQLGELRKAHALLNGLIDVQGFEHVVEMRTELFRALNLDPELMKLEPPLPRQSLGSGYDVDRLILRSGRATHYRKSWTAWQCRARSTS